MPASKRIVCPHCGHHTRLPSLELGTDAARNNRIYAANYGTSFKLTNGAWQKGPGLGRGRLGAGRIHMHEGAQRRIGPRHPRQRCRQGAAGVGPREHDPAAHPLCADQFRARAG